jgi:hypothetical protein
MLAGVRVIGVGWGRTGTASLKVALERLGFGPCYHMLEVVEQPTRARDWLAAARAEHTDWSSVFAGYQSTVDWPGAAFWRELVDAYPDARVILTIRDPQRWYDSMAQTILRGGPRSRSPMARRVLRLLTIGRPEFRDFVAMVNAVVADREFHGRAGDRAYAIDAYERHNADVRASVPVDRLLVFNVAEGWSPLCDFLGVPVPDEPFPHVNDAAEFLRRQRSGMARMALPVAGAAALAVAAAVFGAFAVRRRIRR